MPSDRLEFLSSTSWARPSAPPCGIGRLVADVLTISQTGVLLRTASMQGEMCSSQADIDVSAAGIAPLLFTQTPGHCTTSARMTQQGLHVRRIGPASRLVVALSGYGNGTPPASSPSDGYAPSSVWRPLGSISSTWRAGHLPSCACIQVSSQGG
jgi:hypothetical protein